MHKSKGLTLLAVLVLVAALIAGCGGESAAPGPADGGNGEQKLQGEGQGFNKDVPIKVEVTLVDDQITNIEILEHGETAGVCDPALEQIPEAIIAAQSSKVDAVSGATMTSNGIMEAVANACGK